MKKYLFLFLLFGFPLFAETPSNSMGKVLRSGAEVYTQADFDSKVMTQLQAGEVYEISKKTFGAFYRIRLKNKKLGYIADSDIRPLSAKQLTEKPKSGVRIEDDVPKKRRIFSHAIWRGATVNFVQYQEATMGTTLKDNMILFGAKMTGPDYLLEGDIITDMNFLFSFTPPVYYEQATRNPAQGWLMLFDYMFLTQSQRGKSFVSYFGFGPMIRYSRYDVTLGSTTKVDYTAEDFVLGAKFCVGLGFRLGPVALRSEVDYYIEKSQYIGAGLSMQFEF